MKPFGIGRPVFPLYLTQQEHELINRRKLDGKVFHLLVEMRLVRMRLWSQFVPFRMLQRLRPNIHCLANCATVL